MADRDINVAGAVYPDVPAVELPIDGGGTAKFVEVSDTTATDADVLDGATFYNASGVRTLGVAVVPQDADDVGAWSLVGLTEIPANSNLDAYTTPGNYYIGSANASTVINSPTTQAFMMLVTKNQASSTYTIQYVRNYSGGHWCRVLHEGTVTLAWTKLFPLSPSDIGAQAALSTTTGTITYTAFTNTSSYVRKYGDIVVLNLNGKPKSSISSGTETNIVTLPSGYRPAAETRFHASRGTSGNSMCPARVATDGKVYLKPTSNMTTSDLVYANVTFTVS